MTSTAEDGTPIVLLGLSTLNLDLVSTSPIHFPSTDVGLDYGDFYISDDDPDVIVHGIDIADICIRLASDELQMLRSGGLVERDFESLGLEEPGRCVIFSGGSEYEMLAALKATGLVSSDTKIDDSSLGGNVVVHRLKPSAHGEMWMGIVACAVLGVGAVGLGLAGELEWFAVPVGLLLLAGAVFIYRTSSPDLKSRLELGDNGLRMTHGETTVSLPWDLVIAVNIVPRTEGVLFEETKIAGLEIHGLYGERLVINEEFTGWKAILARIEKETGASMTVENS